MGKLGNINGRDLVAVLCACLLLAACHDKKDDPVVVGASGNARIEAVALGGGFSCAKDSNGKVKCWGDNGRGGQLGQGHGNYHRGDNANEMGDNLPTIDLGSGRNATAFAVGGSHSCALLDNDEVKCWGDNNYGQLGNPALTRAGDEVGEMGDALPVIDLGSGRSAIAIAAGHRHSCALLDDNSVKCWGANHSGQLGLGDTNHRGDALGEMGDALPIINLGSGRTALAIAVSQSHSCALLDDNNVKCWGSNSYGVLGQGDTVSRGYGPQQMGDNLLAIDFGSGRTAQSIATSSSHNCALLDDNSVKCWGRNEYGQLGQGDTVNRGDNAGEMGDALLAIDFGTNRTAMAITAGYRHSCALLDDNSVKCWGINSWGQLGLGDTNHRGDAPGEMGDALLAVDLGGGRTAQAIVTSSGDTCALLDDANIKCWGRNEYGQAGQGDAANRGRAAGQMGDNLPTVELGTGLSVTGLFAGSISNSICAVLSNTDAKCWGFNRYGQLGVGIGFRPGDEPDELGAKLATIDLGTGRTATTIAAGEFHSCALLDDNSVKCWGYNHTGKLGLGDTNHRGDAPDEMGDALLAIDLGSGRTAQSITSSDHNCALLDDSSVKCWGRNSYGQLGLGDQASRGNIPSHMGDALLAIDLGSGRTTLAIAAGRDHSCALLDDNSVKCWGRNLNGQLGQGDTVDRGDNAGEMGDALPAIDLGSGRTAQTISTGGYHSCALLDDNSVKCWGSNSSGQLGQGDRNPRGDAPGEMSDALPAIDLGSGRTALAIAAGLLHTCALLDDNSVKCWGSNSSGQLGQGDRNPRGANPDEMGDNLPAIDLGTGLAATGLFTGPTSYSVCAVLNTKDTKCWGHNGSGQLGIGDVNHRGDEAGEMGDALPVLAP